jgi:hypothetical protein
MYDHTTEMLQARAYDQAQRGESGSAVTLYTRSRRDGRRGRFWPNGSRNSRRLLDLSEIEGTSRVEARSYAGLHTVPIEQIRGSEGRSNDFDRDFHPLQDHCMSRWLRVARARDQDKVLPPVVLVQVGDVYFVRDGHHRISVARALGQLDIEAEVTVWHMTGPLPWETRLGEGARYPVGQRMRDAGRSRVLRPGLVAVWLRSLLPGRTRARGMTAAAASSGAV